MGLKNDKKIQLSYILTSDCQHISNSISEKIDNEIFKDVVIRNSYIKVLSIDGNKHKLSMRVGSYTDKDCMSLIKIDNYIFEPDVTDESCNFIKQGYAYLKTLPEYENAVDILEDGQTL